MGIHFEKFLDLWMSFFQNFRIYGAVQDTEWHNPVSPSTKLPPSPGQWVWNGKAGQEKEKRKKKRGSRVLSRPFLSYFFFHSPFSLPSPFAYWYRVRLGASKIGFCSCTWLDTFLDVWLAPFLKQYLCFLWLPWSCPILPFSCGATFPHLSKSIKDGLHKIGLN